MLGQGGGCHPLAAQKIRRCPLCCLHQRQQQMAGIRLAAPLLPRQHQRRVHLPVHGIGVMCAPALGNDDARAAAKPDEQAHQQVDEGPCCAHRGQRVCAHKVTDDQGVRRVVQLLEQRAEPDGQKEQEQLFGDAARQNIRLFDAFHRISLTFLFLATTFYAIMALM